MTVASTPRGGAWLIEETGEVFTRERLTDEQRLIAQTAEEFVDQEVMPRLDELERKDWALRADARPARGGARPPRDRRARSLRRSRPRQGRRRSSSARRSAAARRSPTTFGAQTGLAITPMLCFGTEAAEAEISAAPGRRRDHRRVRAQRIRIGIGRARRESQSDASAGRQLRPQRRKDVDHERRLRRRVHRLRQGRRPGFHRLHRRTRVSRRQHRQGRAQAGPARLVDHAADSAGRAGCRRRICSARSARATRSRSTR